jgi:hypothetical protein
MGARLSVDMELLELQKLPADEISSGGDVVLGGGSRIGRMAFVVWPRWEKDACPGDLCKFGWQQSLVGAKGRVAWVRVHREGDAR